MSIAIFSSIWFVLVTKLYSKTDTSSPKYCGWLNSGDVTGGGGGNNDGEDGGIDGDGDGGGEDDGGDVSREVWTRQRRWKTPVP